MKMHHTTPPALDQAMPWLMPEIDVQHVDDRPAPMVPADVDCRTFPSLMLDMHATRSLWWIVTDGAAFKAGVTLMVQSWSEMPAGTLPSDDRLLAHLAGMSIDAWRAVKEEALAGWVLCSDDRYHHPEVAKRVMASWSVKIAARTKAKGAANKRWSDRASGGDGEADARGMLKHSTSSPHAVPGQCLAMPPVPVPVPATEPGTAPGPQPSPEPHTGPQPQAAETTSTTSIQPHLRVTGHEPQPDLAKRPPADFRFGHVEIDGSIVERWESTFQSINVRAELTGMAMWLQKNIEPEKRTGKAGDLLAKKEKQAAESRFTIMANAEARAKAGSVAPARRRPAI